MADGVVSQTAEKSTGELEECLEEIIELLRELQIVVEEFQTPGQDIFNRKMERLVQLYQRLDSLKTAYDYPIPVELLGFLDDGRSPDEYVRQSLERCLEANRASNGKFTLMEYFRTILQTEFQKAMPDAFAAALHGGPEDAPASKPGNGPSPATQSGPS